MQRVFLAALLAVSAAAVKDTAADATSKAFLEKYASEEGVVVKESGLMYKIVASGSGGSPGVATPCSCHYEGRTAQEHSKLPPGKKFDSSFDRGEPASFAPNQVIRGWTEALQLMVAGDKWELYIPPRCASIRVRTALAIHVHRTLLG